jgi:transcriptional regulator with XRE-family HTH domain
MTQADAAKVMGVTQARVADLKRGKIDRFSMELLVRLAARAGLKPKLKLRRKRPGSPLVSTVGRGQPLFNAGTGVGTRNWNL